jgi:cytochrome c oxidase subunit 2
MRHRRVALRALLGFGLFALLAQPVAAQTSINSELITDLNLDLLYVAIPITILVEGILIYTVIRYRADKVDEAKPTQENRRLEITWTVATAVILLFVGFAAYQVLGVAAVGGVTASTNPNAQPAAVTEDFDGAIGPKQSETNAVQIEVVAQKYFWEYTYQTEDGTVTGSSTTGEALKIPADRPVYLHITSTDWLHAFHVPDLGLKQDAFPGQYNTLKTVAYEEGSYQLYCAEYCGVGHSGMLGQVDVVSYDEYQEYLEQKQSESE